MSQYSANFDVSFGSGRNNFASTNGAMVVGASIFGAAHTQAQAPAQAQQVQVPGTNAEVKSTAFDRWPFLGGRDQESLHDQLAASLKNGLKPEWRLALDREEAAYNEAFRIWTEAGIALQPPSLSDYPVFEQHLNRLSQIEKGISQMVLNGLTFDEKNKLTRENSLFGHGLRPMHDEVVRRIREEARNFLTTTQVFQREHNRT